MRTAVCPLRSWCDWQRGWSLQSTPWLPVVCSASMMSAVLGSSTGRAFEGTGSQATRTVNTARALPLMIAQLYCDGGLCETRGMQGKILNENGLKPLLASFLIEQNRSRRVHPRMMTRQQQDPCKKVCVWTGPRNLRNLQPEVPQYLYMAAFYCQTF